MERLGFLQLAKRFLQLGKEANSAPEDPRFIQNRPPASRTLSLKIFNRVASSEILTAGNDPQNNVPRSEPPRGHKKKFHSYKEGAAAARARKENADPRLRISSVGRKHVWRRGAADEEVIGTGRPPRILLYQEYSTKVAQIPGINILPDLGSRPDRRPVATESGKKLANQHNDNNNGEVSWPPGHPDSRSSKKRDGGKKVAERRKSPNEGLVAGPVPAIIRINQLHAASKELERKYTARGRHGGGPDKVLSLMELPMHHHAADNKTASPAIMGRLSAAQSQFHLNEDNRTIITVSSDLDDLPSSRASSVSSQTSRTRRGGRFFSRGQKGLMSYSKSLMNLSVQGRPLDEEAANGGSEDSSEESEDEEEAVGGASLASRLSLTAPGSPAVTTNSLLVREAEQLKKYLKDLREGNWTPRPPRKLSLKLPEGRIQQLPEGRIQQLPEGRIQQLPEGRIQQLPEGRIQQLPEGRIQQLPEGRIQQLPEERIQQLEGKIQKFFEEKIQQLPDCKEQIHGEITSLSKRIQNTPDTNQDQIQPSHDVTHHGTRISDIWDYGHVQEIPYSHSRIPETGGRLPDSVQENIPDKGQDIRHNPAEKSPRAVKITAFKSGVLQREEDARQGPRPSERTGRSEERSAIKKEEKREKSIHRKLSRMGGGRGKEKTKKNEEEQEREASHHRKLSRVGRAAVEESGAATAKTTTTPGSGYDVIDELTRHMFAESRREEEEKAESLVEIDFL